MKKKLYQNALITSPIIAVYGASPFYIFEKININDYFLLIFGLSLNVFIIWVVHILYIQKFPQSKAIVQFTATYLANVVVRLLFFFVDPILDSGRPKFVSEHLSYPILTSFALNAIVMVMVKSIVTTYNKAKAEKQLDELKLQNAEAQKQLLAQQLQPHFLFNALSTLKSLISDSPKLAENYTLKLSEFLRYGIQSNQVELVTVEKELQFTQDYIDLQKMRYDNAFEYSIAIPREILQYEIPILALQTIVENIFKHNYFTEKNKLQFSISYSNSALKISNSKTSLKVTPRTKTGLFNLNKRYELICGKSIIVEDDEHNFTVTLPIVAT
jgi:two-component system, LytTR family, sensor kinase